MVAQPAPAPVVSSGRRWDIIVSVALVVFGAYATFSSLAQYANFQTTIETVYATYGYTGTYSNPSLATTVGIALNIVQPIALIIAVFFTARRLRAGKIAFWVPLTAGAAVSIISAVLILVVIFSDSAFVAFFEKSMGT